MKYPNRCNNIIDVTKAPYFADNTGKTDCTAALIRAFDDVVLRTAQGFAETSAKLKKISDNYTRDVYIGRESARVVDGIELMTFPEFIPQSKILYFPKGEYLVSDTVTYSKNVQSRQQLNYYCEQPNNIHFLGEDRENTVIRLKDGLPSFNAGKKPVLCFNRRMLDCEHKGETTNNAFMNTVCDLTVDCGKGNRDAVGIVYASSNTGRIENVSVKSGDGAIGIIFDVGSEGCVRNVEVSGFDYGFKSWWTSPLVFENVDVSKNKNAGFSTKNSSFIFHDVRSGNIPTVSAEGKITRIVTYDVNSSVVGEKGSFDLHKKSGFCALPQITPSYDEKDCAFIEDFGAVGDGVTDCSLAIQKAFESGKATVLFGSGPYLIERKIKVPKTVKCVDFLFANLYSGSFLSSGEYDCCFEVGEDGDEPILFTHLYTHEQFFGFFHIIGHKAKRDVVIRDFQTLFAPVYFNTVGGSTVYIDNSFTSTGTYSQRPLIKTMNPVFSQMIPYDFDGQTVIARNLNVERANLEVRCRNANLVSYGYKTEGPGIAMRLENAKADLNVCNHFIWLNATEEQLYELEKSELSATGAYVGMFEHAKENCVVFKDGEKALTVFDVACDKISDDWFLFNSKFKS